VTDYWPEFGAHGKANVTVEMLVSHQAGLAAIDKPIAIGVCVCIIAEPASATCRPQTQGSTTSLMRYSRHRSAD
jgi:CubicO group peptidase (beta-lactamase class C family)